MTKSEFLKYWKPHRNTHIPGQQTAMEIIALLQERDKVRHIGPTYHAIEFDTAGKPQAVLRFFDGWVERKDRVRRFLIRWEADTESALFHLRWSGWLVPLTKEHAYNVSWRLVLQQVSWWLESLEEPMPCGHFREAVASSDEGTSYCRWCAEDAKERS